MPAQTLLNDKPARNPGQSLDEKINNIEGVAVNDAAILFAVPLMLCAIEWARYFFTIAVNPFLLTPIYLCISAFAVFRMFKVREELRTHRLGREGERVVGQYLYKLNYYGYRVTHDVVFERGNIDHLIVCTKGVFTIETKALRKSGKGDGKISYDGNNILRNGIKLERNPVPQAKGQAKELKKFIKRKAGSNIHVQPVVVFPDWFVENEVSKELWLLSHKQIRHQIDKLPDVLSQKEVDQICGLLYEHVISEK